MQPTIKDIYAQALHIESVLDRLHVQIAQMKVLQEFIGHTTQPSHCKVAPGVFFDLKKGVFIVNVGNGYLVEQTANQVSTYLSEQVSLQTKYVEQLTAKLASLEQEAQKDV
jgi:GMP synthase PP-ATPase subunit